MNHKPYRDTFQTWICFLFPSHIQCTIQYCYCSKSFHISKITVWPKRITVCSLSLLTFVWTDKLLCCTSVWGCDFENFWANYCQNFAFFTSSPLSQFLSGSILHTSIGKILPWLVGSFNMYCGWSKILHRRH